MVNRKLLLYVLVLVILAGVIWFARQCGYFPGRLSYHCSKCSPVAGSDYWTPLAVAVGLDPKLLKSCGAPHGSVWVYDHLNTCVGAGKYGDPCAVQSLNCSTHSTTMGQNGYGADQMTRVKEAVDNGGIHNECPYLTH